MNILTRRLADLLSPANQGRSAAAAGLPDVKVKVVGVGGAGCNAVVRMAASGVSDLDLLAVNTDMQALRAIDRAATFAIGPAVTGGMGSGGNPDVGRKAVRENQDQMSQLFSGVDMVFLTAGMGGGTGTGAAPTIADMARKRGALTVGVVTTPFSFEGDRRREVAEQGVSALRQKVDTLITIDNDRLLAGLDGKVSLESAFHTADAVLRDGVRGIWDLIAVPGLINVDFADVRSVMHKGGPAFMAMGNGRGASAAHDAVRDALASPLFDSPMAGCSGVIMNVRGGKGMSLEQVDDAAGLIRHAGGPQTQVIFGVVSDPKMKDRVTVTLVATGVGENSLEEEVGVPPVLVHDADSQAVNGPVAVNGHAEAVAGGMQRLV